MQVWKQIKIVRTLGRLLLPPNVLFLCLPLEALTQPLFTEVPGIPRSCDPPRVTGWVSVSHAMVALVESNYAAGKAVWTEGPVSLYCRENEEGDHQEMGTWFSQLSLLNFLELQVTPNPSCWSWQNFYWFTRYPPGVCWGDSPLTCIASIPTVWGGLGGMCPHMPLWLLLLFLLCGGEFWHAPSFQITGQSGRGMPRKSVLYLPIVPFTQCSCPSGLEGNLGNSGLCAPVAFHPPGFSDNPRRVSHTDLAPPQASCPCRSFARLLEYCFQASGLKAESKKCLSD